MLLSVNGVCELSVTGVHGMALSVVAVRGRESVIVGAGWLESAVYPSMVHALHRVAEVKFISIVKKRFLKSPFQCEI